MGGSIAQAAEISYFTWLERNTDAPEKTRTEATSLRELAEYTMSKNADTRTTTPQAP